MDTADDYRMSWEEAAHGSAAAGFIVQAVTIGWVICTAAVRGGR